MNYAIFIRHMLYKVLIFTVFVHVVTIPQQASSFEYDDLKKMGENTWNKEIRKNTDRMVDMVIDLQLNPSFMGGELAGLTRGIKIMYTLSPNDSFEKLIGTICHFYTNYAGVNLIVVAIQDAIVCTDDNKFKQLLLTASMIRDQFALEDKKIRDRVNDKFPALQGLFVSIYDKLGTYSLDKYLNHSRRQTCSRR